DSTNAEREGMTPSEAKVGVGLDVTFHKANGRIIVSTFSSNIQRIQQIIQIASQHGRKVALVGRSIQQVAEQAHKMGFLTYQPGIVLRIEELKQLPPQEICIITTGSQGEPMSGLSRLAHGDHKHIDIMAGDTVIFSAVPIPGNERLVHRTINRLFTRGAEVIYEGERSPAMATATQHVSGHASQEELKIMLALTRPRYFVPVHGEAKHLVHHAELAVAVGVNPEHVFIMNNGEVLELAPHAVRFAEPVPSQAVLVDGKLLRDIGASMLKDRKQLAMDGIVAAVATIAAGGELLTEPAIMSQGFVHSTEWDALLEEARLTIASTIAACSLQQVRDTPRIKQQLREDLARVFYERSGRRPVIMVMLQTIGE
ncbi:MAG: ribonuclease J, partial [Cyanobacteria bacterium NC_groundwater_1444_Ag_S-0.65um_54_12]|nr:ribonuclease J [Cyanobacteria bacterium NC_groundwater_1444_Ag_S-0.65um_54_12]